MICVMRALWKVKMMRLFEDLGFFRNVNVLFLNQN